MNWVYPTFAVALALAYWCYAWLTLEDYFKKHRSIIPVSSETEEEHDIQVGAW